MAFKFKGFGKYKLYFVLNLVDLKFKFIYLKSFILLT